MWRPRCVSDAFDRFVEWDEVPATDTATLALRMKEFVHSLGERRSWFWMFNLFDTHRSPGGRWINQQGERPRFDGAQLANLSAAFSFLGHDFASHRLLTDIGLYYRAVERVDLAVRHAIDALREIGALENTLVIFTADHGPAFTRAKLTLYERGLRVPLIVRWPAQWRARADLGQRAELVSLVDVFQTIVTLTAPPAEPAAARSDAGDWVARSLLTRASVARQAVYSVFYAHGRACCEPSFMVRRGDMKLIYHPLAGATLPNATHGCGGVAAPDNFRLGQVLSYDVDSHAHALLRVAQAPPRFQLFNLSADAREFENLADVAELKSTRNELFALLRAFFSAVPTMVATQEERAEFLRLVPNTRWPQCGVQSQ
jgi:hypothetical protein